MIVHVAKQSPEGVTFKFEAHFITMYSGAMSDPLFNTLLQSLLPDSSYHLCPGLPESIGSQLTFDVKNARKWGTPFNRFDHIHCKLWFPLEKKLVLKSQRGITCEFCTKLFYYSNRRIKTQASIPPEEKDRRAQPSSHCPVKYLTPKSKQLRATRKKKQTLTMRKTIDKY